MGDPVCREGRGGDWKLTVDRGVGRAGATWSVRVLQSAASWVTGCGAYQAGQGVAWGAAVSNGMTLWRF